MDQDILEMLYRRYYSTAYLYCLSLCADHQLAQDLVADAFVKAYLSLPNEVPSFRYWLLRVCKNLWIDHCRANARLAGPEAIEFAVDPATPESRYFENEQKRLLWNAIRSLSPADRELVLLHYFADLPLKEIASLTGKSYAAIRQQITRLRQKLKQQLEENGYGI